MLSAKHPQQSESSHESVRSNDPRDGAAILTGDRTLSRLGSARHAAPDRVRCPCCFEVLSRGRLRPSGRPLRLRCPRCGRRVPPALLASSGLPLLPAAPAGPPGKPPRHPAGVKCRGEGHCPWCVAAAHAARVEQLGKAEARARARLEQLEQRMRDLKAQALERARRGEGHR